MEVRRGAGMQPVAGDDERGARLDKTIDTPARRIRLCTMLVWCVNEMGHPQDIKIDMRAR